ncbi:proline racemase family protein [Paramicrobacterium sp. CJ85]|uniref:proline racemase family protein n=1 Tax=Paramicrobacterium sp. CJ85 TaxID=3445355 RepID=UPI003F5FD6D2
MDAVTTTDYHTAGEPFRIVAFGFAETSPLVAPGLTVAERRVRAMTDPDVDGLRRFLCLEPRGHADMYGGFITPPDDDGAHFGVLFWHKDGFSTACGHGTIALGVWAIESGLVAASESGITDVIIDVPSGRVTARVHTDARVPLVDFVSVPSYVLATAVPVSTALGDVTVDVSYGGAIYAQLDAASVGLTVEPKHIEKLTAVGREIKWALDDASVAKHPSDDRLSGIYGTIIYETLDAKPGTVAQRNVTVFADGQVDRSPCGSGTAARIATLAEAGKLRDETLEHGSIVGSTFVGRILSRARVEGRDGVVPLVTGTAFRTGESTFTANPHDTLIPFALR